MVLVFEAQGTAMYITVTEDRKLLLKTERTGDFVNFVDYISASGKVTVQDTSKIDMMEYILSLLPLDKLEEYITIELQSIGFIRVGKKIDGIGII